MELSDDFGRGVGDHKSAAHALRREDLDYASFPDPRTLSYDDDMDVKALPIKLDSLQRPPSMSRVSFSVPSKTRLKAADPYSEMARVEIRPSFASIDNNRDHERRQEMRETRDEVEPLRSGQNQGSIGEDMSGRQGSTIRNLEGVEMENSCASVHLDELRGLERARFCLEFTRTLLHRE